MSDDPLLLCTDISLHRHHRCCVDGTSDFMRALLPWVMHKPCQFVTFPVRILSVTPFVKVDQNLSSRLYNRLFLEKIEFGNKMCLAYLAT